MQAVLGRWAYRQARKQAASGTTHHACGCNANDDSLGVRPEPPNIFVGNSDVEKAHEMRQVWIGKTVGGAHSA